MPDEPISDAYEPPPGYVLTPAVRLARPKTLGRIALLVAVIVFAATIVVSVVMGIGAIPFAVQNAGGFHYNLDANSSNHTEAALGVAGASHDVSPKKADSASQNTLSFS